MMMMLLLLRLQQTEKSVDLASYYSGEGGAWAGGLEWGGIAAAREAVFRTGADLVKFL